MRNHLLAGLLSFVALIGSLLIGASESRGAELVNFNWSGANGYNASGSFAFDPAITPVSFSEVPGVGAARYLLSFNVSFFDPSHTLLENGSSIMAGVSSDRFFRLDYNTQTQTITSLDADIGGSTYQYFLTNLRAPNGQVVGPGVTTFNFFYRPGGTPFLDSAASVQVTSVTQTPEPGLAVPLALAVIAMIGLAQKRSSE